MGKIVYGIVGSAMLVFWLVAAGSGADFGGKSYKLPPSVRQSPGGYRSFFFWHAGYQAGK